MYYKWNVFDLFNRKVNAVIKANGVLFAEDDISQRNGVEDVQYKLASAEKLVHPIPSLSLPKVPGRLPVERRTYSRPGGRRQRPAQRRRTRFGADTHYSLGCPGAQNVAWRSARKGTGPEA